MKILLLSRYSSLGASSRFRLYQYLPYLKSNGCEVAVHPLLGDDYIHYLYDKTPFPISQLLRNYLSRIGHLLLKHKYDLIWLQQEAFPWVPSWFEEILLKSDTPIVVDHDDAFFHRYDMHKSELVRYVLGKKIDRIMFASDSVVAGNEYLAERANKAGCKNIFILPTVVDTNLYKQNFQPVQSKFTIGWLGSPHTAKYLSMLIVPLKKILEDGETCLRIVGSKGFSFEDIPAEFIEWSEQTEVENIQSFNVGLMPLLDSPWERGKCGFKLIQYMACGIPVIASPVGVNSKIVQHGMNGFLAQSSEEWVHYLRMLKQDKELREKFGLAGRMLVEEKYSLHVTAPQLLNIFKSAIKDKREY
jgi:glycosyltransferase involved in cell wall biosynthesis